VHIIFPLEPEANTRITAYRHDDIMRLWHTLAPASTAERGHKLSID